MDGFIMESIITYHNIIIETTIQINLMETTFYVLILKMEQLKRIELFVSIDDDIAP